MKTVHARASQNVIPSSSYQVTVAKKLKKNKIKQVDSLLNFFASLKVTHHEKSHRWANETSIYFVVHCAPLSRISDQQWQHMQTKNKTIVRGIYSLSSITLPSGDHGIFIDHHTVLFLTKIFWKCLRVLSDRLHCQSEEKASEWQREGGGGDLWRVICPSRQRLQTFPSPLLLVSLPTKRRRSSAPDSCVLFRRVPPCQKHAKQR